MKGRLHWSSIASYLFWSILFIVGGIVCLFLQRTEAYMGGAALIVLGVVTYLIGWVVRTKTEFAVTTTRFIQKDGIFNIKMTEIPLGKIETVNFYQTFWQRLLGTGCLELLGSGGTSHKVHCIENPMEVRKTVVGLIR